MDALGKLVIELLLAVQMLAGFDPPAVAPEVVFVPQEILERQACDRPCKIYGWFPNGRTIYLDDRLDPLGDPGARAVLVHELVHYLQQESGAYGRPLGCRDWLAREREAFDVQIRWMAENGVRRRGLVALDRRLLGVACETG
jgi:hypothetical protein